MAEISLSSYANLRMAAPDLAEVQLVTQAIRTADLSSAAQRGGSAGINVGPAATYEPRAILHRDSRIEPRGTIYTTRAIQSCTAAEQYIKVRCMSLADEDFCRTVTLHLPPWPIRPPWATLPWPRTHPASSSKVIKLIIRQSDNRCSGTILDCFI